MKLEFKHSTHPSKGRAGLRPTLQTLSPKGRRDLLSSKVLTRSERHKICRDSVYMGAGAPQKFLRVKYGTGRNFFLPVPPEMNAALEANAWAWGLNANQYKPEVRT